ncbi:MAG: hypothetical protein GY869_10405 [Planctomycetes bacterium]|nr:hypothetical protein [Planctomycetota bacterium]
MGKRVLLALMVTVLLSGGMTFGQVKVLSSNELVVESGSQRMILVREGTSGEPQQMKEIQRKIAELRAKAREAQERARAFMMQAEELERRLREELESANVQAQIAKLKAQVGELASAAKRADKQGIVEKAQELRMRAEDLAAELKHRVIEVEVKRVAEDDREVDRRIEVRVRENERDRRLEELEGKLKELMAGIDRATGRGERERVAELRREAEEVEQMIGAYVEKKDRGRVRVEVIGEEDFERMGQERALAEQQLHMEELHAMLGELEVGIERAVDRGQEDWARELIQKADDIRGQIEMHAHEMEAHRVHIEIAELHGLAEREQELGHIEEAEAIRREAHAIEQRLHQEMEVEFEEEAGGLENVLRREFGKVHEIIRNLHGEMEKMRQEIEMLKQKIRG